MLEFCSINLARSNHILCIFISIYHACIPVPWRCSKQALTLSLLAEALPASRSRLDYQRIPPFKWPCWKLVRTKLLIRGCRPQPCGRVQ